MKKDEVKYQLALEAFLKEHNGAEDLLTAEELEVYHASDYPDNVPILHDALKKRIEEDPDYEVWVPAVYLTWGLYLDNECSHYATQYQFVSNKGRFINLRGYKSKSGNTGGNSDGYRSVHLKLEGFNKPHTGTRIHRLVAAVFIPRPDHLKDRPYHELEVNHIVGIKNNNDFTNLEWCTRKENVEHAVNTGLHPTGMDSPLTKPVIGTCVLEGYEGKEVLLAGSSGMRALGFKPNALSYAVKSGKSITYGCTWRRATNQDIINHNNAKYDLGFIEALKTRALRLKGAIEGTHTVTGHKVLFTGRRDMVEQGFHASNVYSVVNGKLRTHKGYVFKRVTVIQKG